MERCSECYPECGRHLAGCVFSTDFMNKLPGESQSQFDYWLIADACPQYHG